MSSSEQAGLSAASPRNFNSISDAGTQTSFDRTDAVTSNDHREHDGHHATNKVHDFANGHEIDVDDAIEMIGMGRFQLYVLFAAGLCFVSDGIEVMLLSFLGVVLRAEWDLSEREMDTVISIVFVGEILGTLCLGPLADRIGRKPMFVATASIIAVFGLLTAFVQTIEWFYVVRFVVGFGVGGLTIPFDMLAEFIPSSHRGTNLLNIEFFWTAGSLLVPLLAKWTMGNGGDNAWRWFVGYCAIPCIISVIIGIAFVPESPRWLLTQGRQAEAVANLRRAANVNGKDGMALFPDGVKITQSETEVSDDGACAKLLSPKWYRITLRLCTVFCGVFFMYYGSILLPSVLFSTIETSEGESDALANDGDGGGDERSYDFDYNAIFVSGSSEVLGLSLALAFIDRLGRIKTQVIVYLVGGTAVLILGFLYESGNASRSVLIGFAFLSRMFMMAGNCTAWVSISEILTTEIRSTGHSAANSAARLGAFFSPYIVTPGVQPSHIGIIMFVVSIVTAYIVSGLPETSGKALGGVVSRRPAANRTYTEMEDASVSSGGDGQPAESTGIYSALT